MFLNRKNKKKLLSITKVILIGLVLNFFFFLIFPIINYLKNTSIKKIDSGRVNVALTQVNLKEKEKIVKKIKVKQERPKRKSPSKTFSRFKMKFGSGVGSGANLESKKISGLIYQEGDVDKLPRRKKYNIPSLEFPPSLKGNVIKILIQIDEVGQVIYAEVIEGVDGYSINETLKNALLRWEFYPATINNIPVKIEMIQPIRL